MLSEEIKSINFTENHSQNDNHVHAYTCLSMVYNYSGRSSLKVSFTTWKGSSLNKLCNPFQRIIPYTISRTVLT